MKKQVKCILATSLLLAGTLTPAQAASTYPLSIAIDGGWEGVGDTKAIAKSRCKVDEYEVIGKGTRFVVKSSTGRVLGTKAATWTVSGYEENVWPILPETDGAYTPKGGQTYYVANCRLYVKMNVPKSSFYEVRLGTKDGGTYSFGELKADKWKLVLSYR
jgi:hypothetical protein